MRVVAAAVVVILCASVAHATDGVIEINQASALAGGVTACDTPGFPVDICQGGSFRLTSDLSIGALGGIAIHAADVTVDLNGNTIRGDNQCTIGADGWVTSCAHAQTVSSSGIKGPFRTVVANGRVIGTRGVGVFLDEGSELRDVLVSDGSSDGVWLGGRSSASNVSAIGNRFVGLTCGARCSLTEVEALNNGTNGVVFGAFGRVSKALASVNALDGLQGGRSARVSDSVASDNGQDGISVDDGSSVAGVTAYENDRLGIAIEPGSELTGFSASRNGISGVSALDGSIVSAGSLRDNGRLDASAGGLFVQGGAGYRELVITSGAGGNPSSVISFGGVNLGNNTCQGVACP